MNDVLNWILGAVGAVDPVLRTILAGVGMLLETSVLIGLVVPGDTIVIVASTVVDGPVEYFGLIVAVILGALAGESIGFYLGRRFGPWIRRSWLGRRIGEKNWAGAESYLARRGGIAVFLSRFLPVLHSVIPLTVGMSTMRYRTFLAWTVPACVVWTLAYVSVGAAAAEGYRNISDRLHFAGYLFVAVIALFGVVVVLVKRWLKRREARFMDRELPPE
ncbi:DedA family protein [Cryobacterium sp. SO2]|uniref:DedA family protein n=1 Tax=Cryobacterium sp. SO2 TaxID=1897060 RepID=UPI00223D6E51|nr:DedA family protein [Cryobacterium sp. SO2]WEO79069.1 DedA family protein [Cryobacterium sp. SO2]